MCLASRGAAASRLLGAVILMGGAAVAAQELSQLLETVEVRVVNVDVVVSDDDGRPVRGLVRSDFELLVDGEPVPVEYFSSVAGGQQSSGVDSEPPATMPYLAIVYDGRGPWPATVRNAVETVTARLDGLLARTRGVMVLRQGTSLVVEQPMTRDRELLTAALGRLARARTPALDAGDRGMLLHQIESVVPARLPGEGAEESMEQQARVLLSQIRVQAEQERLAAAASGRQLSGVIRSLAGLPGRKAILLLGPGLQQRPAEALFRVWWSRFSRYAVRIGAVSIEAELGRVRNDNLLTRLVDEANAHRVTFYTHDPAGLRAVGSSAEYSTVRANVEVGRETKLAVDSLADLALATGGIARVRAPGVGPLLDQMLNGFGSYYSLGFTPEAIERGGVRVRLREPGLRVRHLKQFALRSAAQQLEESTLATLLTEVEDNRLEIAVELGEAQRQPDDTYLVPLLIKVPMARLALLPARARHVGRLSFVVIARSADGGLSSPAAGAMPIEIANAELLSAMGRTVGYRLWLRTRGGEQVVAIGVRDEVSRQQATLRLVLSPERGA